jgi:hypothetical protein
MEKLSNIEEKQSVRNSVDFGKSLEEKGLSYADVYYRLNGAGITEFNNVLTKSGALIQGEGGHYRGNKSYHASDNGKRSQEETELDCAVGNIQEKLFCMDNIDFKPNPKATNISSKKDSDITTKELDLIHIPTGVQVEFKTSYSKFYGKDNNQYSYYRHRDSGFKDFMRSGKIMIIYFVNLDKVAVISKKYFEDPEMGKDKGSVKLKKEHEWSNETKKFWDHITVWKGIMIDYDMMVRGNSAISDAVTKLVKYR